MPGASPGAHQISSTNAFVSLLFLQVSFYRGEIPNHLPEDVVKKRKGNDSQWLATLPLRLPVSVDIFRNSQIIAQWVSCIYFRNNFVSVEGFELGQHLHSG